MSLRISFFLSVLLINVALGIGASQAAVIELGLTGNYRKSSFDASNFQDVWSGTASFGYYFFELSALEFSYTRGESALHVQATGSPKQVYETAFQMYGLDLILTFGGRTSSIQPYIKGGGAYMQKALRLSMEDGTTVSLGDQEGLVPSAGLGVKIQLTQTFSLKLGADWWTSPKTGDDDPVTSDWAGRVGITWYL